ncbi:MAG: DUF493 family protein YbeD [Buchnera aphidicola (Brevicoryne brassicae)]|uniref:UPF0250 protein OW720_02520 n=1 Tax=Buchnera aphidicola (Brevicoryne brassicae) TaxID=911343 RepID=A0AAJ5TX78_9GAMM|nr:DUF493 family protein YbeD [Buchnera aphidicola]QCI20034.1 DUF493 family protein [Buchnera aphidicola (Brevicoryne brassicae)]WAI18858.1 MAG: DUF493 family protein YbeD [Buchnera aphidicola (Brevicoryne brassicae)]
MKTKLREMLKFPCFFTYKIIGLAQPELIDQIIKVIQTQIPGDYTPQVKSSNRGNYLSVSITICAKNFEQIEILYHEISKINIVRMVL